MPMFVGALVLIGFASWFSYSHLKQELRRHLIEHGDYIATTIVESARSVDSYDQIRFALEQISLKTSGLHGVTLASVDPFIIWASSYHPGSNGNEAGRDMLAAMRMVQDAGLFGKFVLPGGDIVITHPLEQDFPDTRANTRSQHNPGQTDFGTFQPIDIFPIPVGEFKGVLYLRLDWETVIANARQHMLTQAAIVGLGAVAVLLFSLVLVYRLVLNPVSKLVQLARRQQEGEISARADELPGDEIGELGGVINRMLDHLEDSGRQFRDLYERQPDPAWIIAGNRFIECNNAAVEMLGHTSKASLINTHPSELSPEFQPDGQPSMQKAEQMMELAKKKNQHRFNWVHKRADGSEFVAEVTLSAIQYAGRPAIYCIWRDVTEQVEYTLRLERYQTALLEWARVSHEDVNQAFRQASEVSAATLDVPRVSIWLLDEENSRMRCEDLFEDGVGHTKGTEICRADNAEYFNALEAGITQSMIDAQNDQRTRSFAENYLVPNHVRSILDIPIMYDGSVKGVVRLEQTSRARQWSALEKEFASAIASSISLALEVDRRKRAEDELTYMAYHDELTGLPNRSLLADRLDQAVRQAKRDNTLVAVFFLDLDNFKQINDSFGHMAGDQLLQQTAARMTGVLRETDTISRLGGDEFALLISASKSLVDVNEVAMKLSECLQASFQIEGREIFLTSSMGISVYPNDGSSAQELLRNADAAMYRAKEDGKNGYQFYTADLTEKAFDKVLLISSLRRALSEEELEVYYQPQLDMVANRVTGMEALLRWHHSELGQIPPSQFIPVAEESGLIVSLDRWTIRKTMEYAKSLLDNHAFSGRMSANVAVQQLAQGGFVEYLKASLDATGCPAESLALEITEGQILKNPDVSIDQLHKIRELGIEVHIDDFGTGYSSLTYLKKLPVDKIKIDRSFVRDITEDKEDAAIVRAVIALARSLDIDVIAEGVETQQQVDFLVKEGCAVAQGFYYARPMPSLELSSFLADH